jgi:hypothetical protein
MTGKLCSVPRWLLTVALGSVIAITFLISPQLAIAAQDIDVSPTSLAFGHRQVGTQSPAQTVTVSNTGDLPLQIGTVSVNSSQFTTTNGCSDESLGAAGFAL